MVTVVATSIQGKVDQAASERMESPRAGVDRGLYGHMCRIASGTRRRPGGARVHARQRDTRGTRHPTTAGGASLPQTLIADFVLVESGVDGATL